jgi:hypothetical protein
MNIQAQADLGAALQNAALEASSKGRRSYEPGSTPDVSTSQRSFEAQAPMQGAPPGNSSLRTSAPFALSTRDLTPQAPPRMVESRWSTIEDVAAARGEQVREAMSKPAAPDNRWLRTIGPALLGTYGPRKQVAQSAHVAANNVIPAPLLAPQAQVAGTSVPPPRSLRERLGRSLRNALPSTSFKRSIQIAPHEERALASDRAALGNDDTASDALLDLARQASVGADADRVSSLVPEQAAAGVRCPMPKRPRLDLQSTMPAALGMESAAAQEQVRLHARPVLTGCS